MEGVLIFPPLFVGENKYFRNESAEQSRFVKVIFRSVFVPLKQI